MRKIIVLLTVLTVFSITGLADIPPYKPTPKPTSKPAERSVRIPMSIRVNPNVNETTLEIPKSLVKDLRAALDDMDNGNQNAAAVSGFYITPAQTLMGGIFMSLAMIAGGLWLFRAKPISNTVKVAGSLVIAVLFGAASASIISANVAPPPLKGIDGSIFSDKMRSHWRGTIGDVKVSVNKEDGYSEKGQIILTVPRSGGEKTGE